MMKLCSSAYSFLTIQYCGTAAMILAEMYWQSGGEVCHGGCICTYCKTKHTSGHLGNYTIESLLEQVINLVVDRVKDILISSKDTGGYGRDIGVNLPILLKAIVTKLPSDRSTMF
ncbi:hypothetical protein GIB67_032264 [Kingdonia uniflora]|uniref:Uncharacterized protein n=1 Tax=Kingdonia uniflora TaxID=39325 RepID=A0A7J7MX90_9MAGN|nr:hypothetical protein GIB67_032264 [Kingdonia uniflora]